MSDNGPEERLRGWFAERIPKGWFDDLRVTYDRDEIQVVGTLGGPEGDPGEAVGAFREDTRARRMEIAAEAERSFGRKVSWGVAAGDAEFLFTHLSIPVMTRLRVRERALLDTLVDSGVARSRSDALAWCARLVADNEEEWIEELRDALVKVREVRDKGPGA